MKAIEFEELREEVLNRFREVWHLRDVDPDVMTSILKEIRQVFVFDDDESDPKEEAILAYRDELRKEIRTTGKPLSGVAVDRACVRTLRALGKVDDDL